MPSLQLTIPAQDSARPGVRIKPREVREWLNDLPYLDLPRAARLASEQLRLMNRQTLAPGTRLEILGCFLEAWQRLLDSLPVNKAEAAPIEDLLKRLSQDIGFGYKIVVHDLVNRRGRIMESRNLAPALLGAIYTLGLQLTDCYAHYRNAPRALWSECLALFRHAWSSGRSGYAATLAGNGTLSIEAAFRLIALQRQADPYRLPAGTIPLLRQYFLLHSDLSRIEDEAQPGSLSIRLLDSASASGEAPESALYLNLTALHAQMEEDIERLERTGHVQSLGLSGGVAAITLVRTLRQIGEHWQNHPTRKAEREAVHTRIEVVNGLDAAWCVLNEGRCFDPALFAATGEEQDIDLGLVPDAAPAPSSPPQPFRGTSIDRSSGGVSIRYRGEQRSRPRVGQLAALRRPGSGGGWVVAAYRWLIEADNGFDAGLQYLARAPQPVAIRRVDEAGFSGDFRPALTATQRRGEERIYTLITGSGEIREGSEVSVYADKGSYRIRCSERLEAGTGFERFIYELLQP